MTFRSRRHTKQINPPGAAPWKREPQFDTTLAKAVVRAFRWRDLLECGSYSTIRELAKAENINESYVARILRLTLLSPDIIERVLNGRTEGIPELSLLLSPFPIEWRKQLRPR